MQRLMFIAGPLFFFSSLAAGKPEADSSRLTWNSLRQIIQNKHPRSVDELLAHIPMDLLKRHLLIYDSKSLQYASFLSPRVVVYNDDADFVMTFNGEPGSSGYDSVEALSFNRGTNRFEPKLVEFDPDAMKPPVIDERPENCADCHQANIRPNWEPYFHWVGFYGSEDDFYQNGPDSPLMRGHESQALKQFQGKKMTQIQTGKGRYRFLPEHPSPRPNLDFDDRITCLNSRRILQIFSEQPLSGRAWAAADDGRARGWFGTLKFDVAKLPSDLLARATRRYEEVRAETEQVIWSNIQGRIQRHTDILGEPPLGRVAALMHDKPIDPLSTDISYDLENVASMRFVFEEVFHIPFRPLSMSRLDDFQIGLPGEEDLYKLVEGAYIDPVSQRVKFNTPPSQPDYEHGYNCMTYGFNTP